MAINGPAQADTDNVLLQKILRATLAGGGGGGGGGGAVTVVDGGDVAQGAKADTAATDSTSAWTIVALLKGIFNNTSATSGNVGGYTTVIKDTAVVTAATYASGYAVGAKRTLLNAVRAAGTGVLQSVAVLDRSNSKAEMMLYLFDSDPAAATITDNASFVFSTDDLKVIAAVHVASTDYITVNSKAIANLGSLGIPLKAASGTTLYAVLVTLGTPTFAATTNVQVEVGILQD